MATIGGILGGAAAQGQRAGEQLGMAVPYALQAVARLLEQAEEKKERAEERARAAERHPIEMELLRLRRELSEMQIGELRQQIEMAQQAKITDSAKYLETQLPALVEQITTVIGSKGPEEARAAQMRMLLELARSPHPVLTPEDRARLIGHVDRAAEGAPGIKRMAEMLALEDWKGAIVTQGAKSTEEALALLPEDSPLRDASGEILPEYSSTVPFEAASTIRRQKQVYEGTAPEMVLGAREMVAPSGLYEAARMAPFPVPGVGTVPWARQLLEKFSEPQAVTAPSADTVQKKKQQAINAMARFFKEQRKKTPAEAKTILSQFVGRETADKLLDLYKAQGVSRAEEDAKRIIEQLMQQQGGGGIPGPAGMPFERMP